MDDRTSPYQVVALGVLASIVGTVIIMVGLDKEVPLAVVAGYAVVMVGTVASLVGVIAAGVRYGMRFANDEHHEDQRQRERDQRHKDLLAGPK